MRLWSGGCYVSLFAEIARFAFLIAWHLCFHFRQLKDSPSFFVNIKTSCVTLKSIIFARYEKTNSFGLAILKFSTKPYPILG